MNILDVKIGRTYLDKSGKVARTLMRTFMESYDMEDTPDVCVLWCVYKEFILQGDHWEKVPGPQRMDLSMFAQWTHTEASKCL